MTPSSRVILNIISVLSLSELSLVILLTYFIGEIIMMLITVSFKNIATSWLFCKVT